jgi:phosphatidylglycerol:prolipoprotein diacylglycerol transferase
MYPFIHIGHFSIGTFGLCLWLASVFACWVLYANFRRYGVDADAIGVAAYTTVACSGRSDVVAAPAAAGSF